MMVEGGSDSAGVALAHAAFIAWVLCAVISSLTNNRAWIDWTLTAIVCAVGVGLILAVPFGWVERPATGMSGMFWLIAGGFFGFLAQNMRAEDRESRLRKVCASA